MCIVLYEKANLRKKGTVNMRVRRCLRSRVVLYPVGHSAAAIPKRARGTLIVPRISMGAAHHSTPLLIASGNRVTAQESSARSARAMRPK